ncbi:hypothetical protein KHM83_06495 [Fusibacter paucivorans]|uniref:General stress protein CsbD n=1 Tax=Fusibacter paucivorans TaxID=76009 RepID=A0ABS5PMA1_9FIRM|nr:hypothetical protein [Fusibacter paucivorans]MBS7526320.1 hypothetical protein [Fusibacter paucivorans]
MNRNQLEIEWDEMKEEVKMRWDELTDNDLDEIEANLESLVGIIEKRCGVSHAEAEKEVNDFSHAWVNRNFQ